MPSVTFQSINLNPSAQLSSGLCAQLRPLGLDIDGALVVGRGMMFERGVRFFVGSLALRAKIGAYTAFNRNVTLTTATLGRYCSIGHGTEFGLGAHDISSITTSSAVTYRSTFHYFTGPIPGALAQLPPTGEETSEVIVGNDVWVGCHCLFPKSVTIGHGAVIGAGSIITHDVPPYAIVAGKGGGANSQGIIKGYRFPDEVISDLLDLQWWNYDLPRMLVQGIKIPLHNARDFINFMKNEEREHLIPLPNAWYYLNVLNSNSAQIFRVAPELTNMGSLIEAPRLAIINAPELTALQTRSHAQS